MGHRFATGQRRSTARRTAGEVAVGAVAAVLLLGGAACTAQDGPGTGKGPGASQEEPSGGSTSQPGPAPSDGGGEQDEGPLDAAALDAAAQRFVEVLRVLDDHDWEAACGYVLDPSTGDAPEGERLDECADGASKALGPHEDLLVPGAFDAIDASSVTARDEGDGTVSLTVLGEEVDVAMVRGEDGLWYLSIPF